MYDKTGLLQLLAHGNCKGFPLVIFFFTIIQSSDIIAFASPPSSQFGGIRVEGMSAPAEMAVSVGAVFYQTDAATSIPQGIGENISPMHLSLTEIERADSSVTRTRESALL